MAAISREQLVAPLAAYGSRLPLYPMDPISRRRSVPQQNNMLPPVALTGNNIDNIWWSRYLTGHCSKRSLLAEGNRWRYSQRNVAARAYDTSFGNLLSAL
ncbi:hypothetical protein AVEN_242557-1 [Araneus ventricosus]|uniref:Uncharacterized protein n=1 Tax=Araneus ventricosus TaxID=182803 RepID=A0A4Y2M1P1_ARAVE|nr:hypothetical protein AVEN_242557-1 [Araneus ventricosus]